MTFVEALHAKMDAWEDADELDAIEAFWHTLAESHEAMLDGYSIKVLRVTGGPNEAHGEDYEIAMEVDGQHYVALVDYDSYDYTGSAFSIYTAEPYEFTETRYKRLAIAR